MFIHYDGRVCQPRVAIANNMASSKRARVEEEPVPSTSKVIKIDLAGFVSMPISLNDISQSGKFVFICGVCSETFHKRYLLLYHLRLHLKQFPYTCLLCGCGFEMLSSLSFHQTRSHSSNIHCRRCGQSFPDLNSHKCIEIKPFVCEGCGEGFSRFECLVRHSEDCTDYSFYSSHLREYQYHYKGQYSCHTCSVEFSLLSDLIRHRIRVHIQSSVSASSNCTKSISSPSSLMSLSFSSFNEPRSFTKRPVICLERVPMLLRNKPKEDCNVMQKYSGGEGTSPRGLKIAEESMSEDKTPSEVSREENDFEISKSYRVGTSSIKPNPKRRVTANSISERRYSQRLQKKDDQCKCRYCKFMLPDLVVHKSTKHTRRKALVDDQEYHIDPSLSNY